MTKIYEYQGDPRGLTMPHLAKCAWFFIDKSGGEVYCGELRVPGWGYCEAHKNMDAKS